MPNQYTRATLEERFWSKVDRNGPVPEHRPDLGPCWLWTAYVDAHGYGVFSVPVGENGRHAERTE